MLDLHHLRLPGACIVEQLGRFERLGFVDLSWADMTRTVLFKDYGNVLLRHVRTLKGLSLRDTNVGGDKETILGLQQLNNLVYLDLSKPNSRNQNHELCFKDDFSSLKKLNSLVWLNFGGNLVGDQTVKTICHNIPSLRHLGLACCPITSKGIESLIEVPLKTLDITGCRNISDEGFSNLLNVETSKCAQNVHTLLCSFLNQVRSTKSSILLLDLPCLQVIEMRMTRACPTAIKFLRFKLHTAIFEHTDQLKYQQTPDMYSRFGVNQVFDHLSWPYYKR